MRASDFRSRTMRIKLAMLTAAVVLGMSAAALAAALQLPNGPGVNLVYSKCQTCHDLQYVIDAKGLLPNQWRSVVASMKDYGLRIDNDEQEKLVGYLTTYLGPNPPPPSAPASVNAKASVVDGRSVFMQNCASCHGAEGRGEAGYFPPLAGNPDVSKDQLFPVLVVLHGLSGPIEVNGRRYNSTMPPLDHLSDAEVAAVVNFVRGAWSQSAQPKSLTVTPEFVAAQRKRDMTPAEVGAYRAKMN